MSRTVTIPQMPEPSQQKQSTAKGRRVFLGGISQGCNMAQLGSTGQDYARQAIMYTVVCQCRWLVRFYMKAA